MLLTALERADWITLDGGGILVFLIAWALAACFAFAGLVFVVLALIPSERSRRPQRLAQAAFCFALTPLLALVLPTMLDSFPLEEHNMVAALAFFWAPALAGTLGWIVYRLGIARD
jgi:hypothetical protein